MKIKTQNKIRHRNKTILILPVVCLFLLLIITVSLQAKDPLPAKIVTAKAGLNVRETPDASGKKLGLVPFGETVEIYETKGEEVTIAGKSGHWVRIKWKKLNGWAFDAFLGDPGSSSLLEHFKSIAIQITGGCDCSFKKDSGDANVYGECGNGEETVEPTTKVAWVKGDSVMFEYTDSVYTEDESGEGSSTVSYYECAIDGKKILATKKGETLETEVKCTLIKTE